ncbi:dTDP-4-oxo-6-deoxy-D-allose reductase [Candidatus Entotheonellaceae bacterium PAL068K]
MFYHGKRVLVTGGTGFIGLHLVQALRQQGATVRVPLHQRSLRLPDAGLETIPADLTRLEDCQAVARGMDYVFHAAGAVAAAAVTVSNPMAAITTNLVLTAHILQAAWTEGVERALLFGSGTTAYPPADYAIKEEEMWSGPTYPAYFGYGWMRRYLERLSEFVATQSSLKIALVRPTAVYGRWDNVDPATSHVIPALIRRAIAKQNPYEVWGTGEEVRDFLHVTDLARACLLMLEKYATCDPVNIAYGKGVTIAEVVHRILAAAHHSQATVQFDASKPSTIRFRMVDTSKAKKVLGFEPQVSLAEGLSDTVKWYEQTYCQPSFPPARVV